LCDGPFVVIDCGAIPAQLLESELFGSERGAYTGAVAARIGAFEAASGGTIFLDEIGELQLDLQLKILRALERRQIKRVGSPEYRPVDLRVIAATNRGLRARHHSAQGGAPRSHGGQQRHCVRRAVQRAVGRAPLGTQAGGPDRHRSP